MDIHQTNFALAGETLSTQLPYPTPFAALGSGISSSLTLTLITEFGDRTFILAAGYALKNPKYIVFLACSAALLIQTAMSTIVGQILHYFPNKSNKNWISLPIDDYGAAILLFVFGCIHFRAAWVDDCPEDLEDLALPRAAIIGSGQLDPRTVASKPTLSSKKSGENPRSVAFRVQDIPYLELTGQPGSHDTEFLGNPPAPGLSNTREALETTFGSPSSTFHADDAQLDIHSTLDDDRLTTASDSEKVVRGVDPAKPSTFLRIFWIIFAAELGDKSMISTIALSAAQNPYGVFIGTSCAHLMTTYVAVSIGSIMEGYISERFLNFAGAILFMTFACMSIMEGLARQGIHIF